MQTKDSNNAENQEASIYFLLRKEKKGEQGKPELHRPPVYIRFARMLPRGVFFCLLLISAPTLFSQTILNEEFWYDYQPEVWKWEASSPTGYAPSLSTPWSSNPSSTPPELRSIEKEELYERILEEARYVLSGMVYGFVFSYTPSDRARRVEEEFLLEPYHWIQRGDPNLQIFQVRRENQRVFVRVRYTLRDFQEAWYRGMRSNVLPSVAGMGEGPFYLGSEGRMQAIKEAIKQAVREYARGIMYNKPRTLKGILVLDAAPIMGLDSGVYRARVSRAYLRLEEVRHYLLH